MLSNAAIRLLPDWTLAVQLLIFLFVLAVLTVFVIRPLLVDRRRSFTNEAMEGAQKLSAEAEQFEAERRETLSKGLREAQDVREKRVSTARRDADRTIAEARVGVAQLLEHGIESIESAEMLAAPDLKDLSAELAAKIVERFQH